MTDLRHLPRHAEPLRHCVGKRAYATIAAAKAASAHLPPQHARRRLMVYQCLWCGQYHAGHRARPRARHRAWRRWAQQQHGRGQ